MKKLILFSGGKESLLNAVDQKSKGHDITLFTVAWPGTRTSCREVHAAEMVADHLGVESVVFSASPTELVAKQPMWDESDFMFYDGPASGDDAAVKKKSNVVPYRNFAVISLGLMHAARGDFDSVVTGFTSYSRGVTIRDASQPFVNQFNRLISVGTERELGVRVESPLKSLDAGDVVLRLIKSEAPLHLSWSCYNAWDKHCGVCSACLTRLALFRYLGLCEDPARYTTPEEVGYNSPADFALKYRRKLARALNMRPNSKAFHEYNPNRVLTTSTFDNFSRWV